MAVMDDLPFKIVCSNGGYELLERSTNVLMARAAFDATDHYVDERLAARSLGVTAATVREKMANGEIAIGPPPVPTGSRLVTVDAGARYAIETE